MTMKVVAIRNCSMIIIMLMPGNVAYATLDGRPGAYNFDHNQELQHWVSATDIRSTARLKIFNVFTKIFQGFLCAI